MFWVILVVVIVCVLLYWAWCILCFVLKLLGSILRGIGKLFEEEQSTHFEEKKTERQKRNSQRTGDQRAPEQWEKRNPQRFEEQRPPEQWKRRKKKFETEIDRILGLTSCMSVPEKLERLNALYREWNMRKNKPEMRTQAVKMCTMIATERVRLQKLAND